MFSRLLLLQTALCYAVLINVIHLRANAAPSIHFKVTVLLFKHAQVQVLQKYEFPKQMVSFDGILANFLARVDISFHVWAET